MCVMFFTSWKQGSHGGITLSPSEHLTNQSEEKALSLLTYDEHRLLVCVPHVLSLGPSDTRSPLAATSCLTVTLFKGGRPSFFLILSGYQKQPVDSYPLVTSAYHSSDGKFLSVTTMISIC